MAIFTPADIPAYAPLVTVTGGALTALIGQVDLLVQGPYGSNCPIERQVRKEKVTVNQTLQTARFSYRPIDFTAQIKVEGRYGNIRNRYHVSQPLGYWQEIQAGAYLLDEDGQISFSIGGDISDGFNRSLSTYGLTEARLEYTAGINFATSTPLVASLKQAFGGILTAVANGSVNHLTGVSVAAEKDNFLGDSVNYHQSPRTGYMEGIADYLFEPFRAFRPLGDYAY